MDDHDEDRESRHTHEQMDDEQMDDLTRVYDERNVEPFVSGD